MVKTYLRFELAGTHGLVSSPQCNAIFDHGAQRAVCGALEYVHVWNLRQGSLVSALFDEDDDQSRASVTRLARAPSGGGGGGAGRRGLLRWQRKDLGPRHADGQGDVSWPSLGSDRAPLQQGRHPASFRFKRHRDRRVGPPQRKRRVPLGAALGTVLGTARRSTQIYAGLRMSSLDIASVTHCQRKCTSTQGLDRLRCLLST